MSGSGLAFVYCLAGGVLGLWILVRFPSFGPTGFGGAALAFFATGCALSFVPTLLGYAVDHGGRPGALAGLLGIVLPGATAVFWSLACLVRVFCGLAGRGTG